MASWHEVNMTYMRETITLHYNSIGQCASIRYFTFHSAVARNYHPICRR